MENETNFIWFQFNIVIWCGKWNSMKTDTDDDDEKKERREERKNS